MCIVCDVYITYVITNVIFSKIVPKTKDRSFYRQGNQKSTKANIVWSKHREGIFKLHTTAVNTPIGSRNKGAREGLAPHLFFRGALGTLIYASISKILPVHVCS